MAAIGDTNGTAVLGRTLICDSAGAARVGKAHVLTTV